MDIVSKRGTPRLADRAEGAPDGSGASEALPADWISRTTPPTFAPDGSWHGLAPGEPDATPAEEAAARRVQVFDDGEVCVIEAGTARRLGLLGEIRLVDGIWRFALATRANGSRTALAPDVERRLSQLDGVPMGRPRTPEALAAEISSLLGYDAHH